MVEGGVLMAGEASGGASMAGGGRSSNSGRSFGRSFNGGGLCKFYARGACLKGEFCEFVHDSSITPPKKACIYYQRGTCSYGARCRFEHAISFSKGSSASSSSATRPPMTSTMKNPSVVSVLSSVANNQIAPGDSAINSTENPCNSAVPSDPCAENERLDRSQQIECSVCLERVLSKTSASERKFGLLSECDHAFCIACIKIWRSSSYNSGLEVNSDTRACPVCRKVSYYVIPSPIWSSSLEEKQDIINKYKAKLKSIDCRYFNLGNGHCRHGTSCFYKHEVKAGSSRLTKKSSKGKKKPNRATWDDDHLGFGELVELSLLDAMLEEFEELAMLEEFGAPGDEAPESLAELYKKLEQLGLTYSDLESDSDDYDPNFEYDPEGGAIRLEPWQRKIFYEQTGYYDFDDFTDYRNLDYYFGSGALGFGSDDDQ